MLLLITCLATFRDHQKVRICFMNPQELLINCVSTLAPLVVQMFVMQGMVALYDNCAMNRHMNAHRTFV